MNVDAPKSRYKGNYHGNIFEIQWNINDIAELMKELPRIIYHSCDRLAMEKIVEHGLIPGGWPNRTAMDKIDHLWKNVPLKCSKLSGISHGHVGLAEGRVKSSELAPGQTQGFHGIQKIFWLKFVDLTSKNWENAGLEFYPLGTSYWVILYVNWTCVPSSRQMIETSLADLTSNVKVKDVVNHCPSTNVHTVFGTKIQVTCIYQNCGLMFLLFFVQTWENTLKHFNTKMFWWLYIYNIL